MENIYLKEAFHKEALIFIRNITPNAHGATVIALHGDLGAGKTTFVQTIAGELGVTESVVSPTFLIQKTYSLETSAVKWNKLIHIDAYRLRSSEQLDVLGWEHLVKNPKNIILIEWPENAQGLQLENAHHIYLKYINKDKRSISYT